MTKKKQPKIIRGSFGGGGAQTTRTVIQQVPSPSNPAASAPPKPTRTPDTLHSRQFATFLDLISEGEIEGFASPSKEGRTRGTDAYTNAALKDIFLNETPVLKSTADSANPESTDFNFAVTKDDLRIRFGTSDQERVLGVENSSSLTAVGVEVTKDTPVTRTITSTTVDAAKVTLTFPQIQKATDNGD